MIPITVSIDLVIQMVVGLILVVGIFLYARRKERFSIKPLLVGAITFIVFSQVLEKGVHAYFLTVNSTTKAWFAIHPVLFAVYGAFAAGIFEEAGRYIAFRFVLRKNREWRDGVAYGIGHGGIEALLLTVMVSIQTLVFIHLLNNGTFDQTLGVKAPHDMLQSLKTNLITTPGYLYLIGGWERLPAIISHIVFSVLVLYGIRKGKIRYLFYAIFAHAAVDFVPALYQSVHIPLLLVEMFLLLVLVLGLFSIKKIKSWYGK